MADLSHDNLIDEASVFAVGRQPRDVEAGQILLQSLEVRLMKSYTAKRRDIP